ncbi:MAG: trehalose-phosphatase [Spongiibacteraceae bacterium]
MLPVPPVPAATTQWALFLDVDGTLLEFAAKPDAVQVPAGLVSLLLRLQHRLHGALALISGRRLASLDNLFKPLALPAAGLHGFECRDARGVLQRAPIDDDFVMLMQRHGRDIAERFPGVLVEDKQFSIAFHYDPMSAQQASLQRELIPVAQQLGFELLAGHNLLELKPANVNKGKALLAFLEEPPFAGRVPIFLGDDVTDEHALRAVREHGGMAIQVADRITSVAQFGLPDSRAVLQWLQHWEEQFL